MPATIRPAVPDDLPAMTAIYNHYIRDTAITFDLEPFAPEGRRGWFDDHASAGRHRLLVAVDPDGGVLGYATTSRWRPKAAYETTVESTVYCRRDVVGHGVGTALYSALFEALSSEDIHRIVAGISQPNPASVALHLRFGFRQVGVFSNVGRKFGRYWDVAWFERPLLGLVTGHAGADEQGDVTPRSADPPAVIETPWHCPKCGSGPDEHRVERDGPESLDEVVCQRCGTRWPPRPVGESEPKER